jgi:hypothetical protein
MASIPRAVAIWVLPGQKWPGLFNKSAGGSPRFVRSTIGLKVRNDVIKRLTIQLHTGMPVATYAQLRTTESRKTPAERNLLTLIRE